jgi:hypothetical protein
VRSLFVSSCAVLIVLAGACSDDDASTGSEAVPPPEVPAEPTVVNPADDTPFCRTMLEADAVEGSIDDIVTLYVDVSDDVPAEIRPDFDVVLERLVAISGGNEVADPVQAEESAIELAAYIERRCRGTSVSPLPPPTAPHGERND